MAKISYDRKVEELARFFLSSATIRPSEDQVNRLAGLIQKLIENFIEYEI